MTAKTLSSIIDRRISKGKSAENRRKFLERVRDSVRDSMTDIINQGSLKEIAKDGGKVTVKKNRIDEPSFRFGKGGQNDHILPGNKEYVAGDELKKPQSGGGQGSGNKAGEGDGEDPFIVQISREEFLTFFFEDLELPDLVRKDLAAVTEKKLHTAGYSTTGTPAKLALVRSLKMAHIRRIALRGVIKKNIHDLEEKIEDAQREGEQIDPEDLLDAERLMARLQKVPFIDPLDLRYRAVVSEDVPITSATMVCIMDNSGSMQEREKTLARKFFYLLYLFLDRKYDKIDLVFIHHTEKAKEVNEQEFFNTRETGGTLVSSALELLAEMIPKRINPNMTNIYVCQCSDGDNMSSDNPKCTALMRDRLLPYVQYWAYIQIEREGYTEGGEDRSDSLWPAYREVAATKKHLAMRHVSSHTDIYPVFRNLFERRKNKTTL